MRTYASLLTGAALACTGLGLAPAMAQDDEAPSIATVVKIAGIQWFNRMEEGVTQFAEETGVDAFQVGPAQADPQQQAALIEDMIAQGVDALAVVPMSPEALEPVLGRAMDQGITVITHEAAAQEHNHYDIEAFRNEAFGANLMEQLATCMGGQGQYAVFVGSLTVPLHNAWADAAIAYLEENHPEMELVGERHGVAESVDDSRRTALELMSAHPDLEGFLAFGSQGPIGAGRAVAERRKTGEVHVIGPFSPGQGRRLVKDGVISGGFMWNPMEAGRVFVHLGKKLIEGEEIAGTKVEGLGVVEPDGTNIIVDQLIPINAETVDELAGMGL